MTTESTSPTDPPVVTLVRLRADLRAQLDLALYSELEQRVPYGALSEFFNTLLDRYFNSTTPIQPYYKEPSSDSSS